MVDAVERVQRMIGDQAPKLHYFSYDLTEHEAPSSLPEAAESIVLYPEDGKHVTYTRKATESDVLQCLFGEVTNEFEYPSDER
jgi:hypothetical protein